MKKLLNYFLAIPIFLTVNVQANVSEYEWGIDKSKAYPTVSSCIRKKDSLKVKVDYCIESLGVQYIWLKTKSKKCGVFTLENEFVQTTDDGMCASCKVEGKEDAALLELVEQIDEIQPAIQSADVRLDNYAKNIESKYKVVKIDKDPSKVTATSVEYKYYGQKLKPNECLYLKVPEHLHGKPVLFVNLGHTQTNADNTGYDSKKEWDNNPGLTTVQVNEENSSGETKWRYWNGMSSGDYGAKFAEPGSMELEGLYEWYKNGHKDVISESVSYKPLYTDAIRLCSIGKDPVTIGSLILKVAPSKADHYDEYNISKSNTMGDPLTAKGRNYGNRSDALELESWGSGKIKKLGNGLTTDGSTIEVPVKAGKKLESFEISIGDEKKNSQHLKEKDRSGWARLNVRIQKKDGSSVWIIRNENVPPLGVLVGAPEEDYIIQEGDRLIVEPEDHDSFVTGIRVGTSD